MGVGCKLIQLVVFCVLFVMMLTKIEKNSAVSGEGHVLTAYGFFSCRKVGQYADQERAFEIPFPEKLRTYA